MCAEKYNRELGSNVLARLSRINNNIDISENLGFIFKPQFGKVIELTGISGSGKSQFILYTISCAITPTEYLGLGHINGCGVDFVVLTTNSDFNMLRLLAFMESTIIKNVELNAGMSNEWNTENLERCIEKSLEKLHIINCSDFAEIMSSVLKLKIMLYNNPNIKFIAVELSYLFPWPNERESDDEENKMLFIKLLREISSLFHVLIMITNVEIVPSQTWYSKENIKIFNSKMEKLLDGKILFSIEDDNRFLLQDTINSETATLDLNNNSISITKHKLA